MSDFSQFPKPKSSTVTKVMPLLMQMGSNVEARLHFLRRVAEHLLDEGPKEDQDVTIPEFQSAEEGIVVVCTIANRAVTQPNIQGYVQQVVDAIIAAHESLECVPAEKNRVEASPIVNKSPPPKDTPIVDPYQQIDPRLTYRMDLESQHLVPASVGDAGPFYRIDPVTRRLAPFVVATQAPTVITPSPEAQRPPSTVAGGAGTTSPLDIQRQIQTSIERMLRPLVEEMGKARMVKCASCGAFHPANLPCSCASPAKKKPSAKKAAENAPVPSVSSKDSGEEDSEEVDGQPPFVQPFVGQTQRRSKSEKEGSALYRPFKSIAVVTTPATWISLLQDGADMESLGKELDGRYVEATEMKKHHVLQKANTEAVEHILQLLSTMAQMGSWDADMELLENMHLECETRLVHATTGSAEIAEEFRRIVRDEKINPLFKKAWKKVRESAKGKVTPGSGGRNVTVPQMPQAEYEKLNAQAKEIVNRHMKTVRDALKA